MISHQINVFIEPARPKYTPPVVLDSNSKSHPFVNQTTYDKWLQDVGFSVGDFVTLLHANSELGSLQTVHRITRIEQEFAKLTWSSYSREWKPFYLLGLNLHTQPTVNPWVRWDAITGYRHLTQHEHNKLILPVYDKLQDYCTKHG
jgi:hypothetical protein